MKNLFKRLWGLLKLLLWVYLGVAIIDLLTRLTHLENSLDELNKWAVNLRSKGY